jgi:lipid II:glycine glycyltransferase (peptidoglycan interpeptide bridge formation enzyme)
MAPHLLQWRGIERARARGSRYYDFRGIAGSDHPSDPWAGMTRFKKGFGGFGESLVGTWDYPFKPFHYALYRIGRRFFGRTQ